MIRTQELDTMINRYENVGTYPAIISRTRLLLTVNIVLFACGIFSVSRLYLML